LQRFSILDVKMGMGRVEAILASSSTDNIKPGELSGTMRRKQIKKTVQILEWARDACFVIPEGSGSPDSNTTQYPSYFRDHV
jgi:hypothetical protein